MADMVYVLGLDAVARAEDAIPDERDGHGRRDGSSAARPRTSRAPTNCAPPSPSAGYEVRDVAGGFKLVPTR